MEQPPDAMDTAVLTYLATIDGGAAPATIAEDRDWPLTRVLARLDRLAERGLVAASSGGTYELTETGRDTLRGRLPGPGDGMPEWAKQRPDWMQTVDVAVLEALTEAEDPRTIEALSDELEYPVEHLRERCEELAAQGLIQPIEGGAVRLRDLGTAFIAGEIESGYLETGE